jgi:adenylate cyclase
MEASRDGSRRCHRAPVPRTTSRSALRGVRRPVRRTGSADCWTARLPALAQRFYRCAEDVLFPDAVIDKVIGDEVMALYLPDLKKKTFAATNVPSVMLEHARNLLRAVGYGSDDEPFVEVGIGLDVGEAFVGNIGQRALFDFTAVGDVVNTASRLQGQAAGGEIVLSSRVAAGLTQAPGARVELELKGIAEPQTAYRVVV